MLRQDLKYAVRALITSPGFSLVAAATLALGIGANTAIFSVINAVLVRPLPYRDANRLELVSGSSVATRQPGNLSPMDFLDLRQRTRRFEGLAAYNNYADATLTSASEPERVAGTRVTADFFSVLGVAPEIGRDFRADDDVPGAAPVAILARGFWQRRFGGDPSVVGRTVHLNGVATEVVGILPGTFRHPFPENARQPDMYVPFRIDRKENIRGGHYLQAIGRLTSGATRADGETDLANIAADLARQYPDSNTGRTVTVEPLLDAITGPTREPLIVLLGMVVLVLVIACVNLANLLLSRSMLRQKDVAIRQALGASRAQLIRQFLIECLMLALVGGAAGLLVAAWAIRVLVAVGAERIPRGESISLDSSVLLFTLGLSLLTGLVFGVGPAVSSTRAGAHGAPGGLGAPGVNDALKRGGRSGGMSIRPRAEQALIASEIALTLMLLIGAGLLVKSLARLDRVDPGFRPAQVLTLQTSLPIARYPEGDEIPFYQRLEDRLRPLPGVRQVGAVNILPLSGNYSCDGFDIDGRPPSPAGQQPCAEERSITPGYFDAMGIALQAGRGFTRQDTEISPAVMIISDNMATRFWPGQSALGSHVLYGKKLREVVGIVSAVKHLALDRDVPLEMYTPHAQQPSFHTMTLVIRSSVDASSLAPMIRRELSALDRDVPIAHVRAMAAFLDDSTSDARFRTLLIGAFATLALLLAVIGVSGVISYAVSRRTHELGVRVALGASHWQILSLVVRQGMRPTAIGLATGLCGAVALTRVIAGLLFNVSAVDVAVFAASTALLTVAALTATYVPARRATAVDPVLALRAE